jgi:hypothetical protein
LWISLCVLFWRKHSVVVFQRSRLSTLKVAPDCDCSACLG